MSIPYIDLCAKVRAMIKPSRFKHSENVASVASSLARRFSIDPDSASYCGIYHDAYRYSCDDRTVAFCIDNGWDVYPEERENPMLLHGALAAINFPNDAGDIPYSYRLAVRHHTLGSKDMGRLGAIIYIADYIEPDRKHLTDADRNQILSSETLEDMVISIMDMQRAYFDSVNIKEAEVSRELYDFLKRGGKLE